nr:ATPase, T2SS/T4P/T4SS family [Candidatus Njordarchaeum guaymaensis]
MSAQYRYCKILTKNSIHEGKPTPTGGKRLSVLCNKPEEEVCARYSAVPDLSANPACMTRIVDYIRERAADGTVDQISIVSPSITRVYTYDQVKMINEISEVAGKISAEMRGLEVESFQGKCPSSKECSNVWNQFIQRIIGENPVSSDPIKAYINILAEKRSLDGKKGKCSSCRRIHLNLLQSIKRLLQKTTLVSKFLQLRLNYDENERETTYSYFFQPLIIPRIPLTSDGKLVGEFYPTDQYTVGSYTINISVSRGRGENFYSIESPIDKDDTLRKIVEEVTSEIKKVPNVTTSHARFLSLDELLQIRAREASKLIRQRFPEIPPNILSSIAELSCYKSMGMESIAPLLIDEDIEEFFIDQPGAFVYLDHRKWGRCRTNIVLPVSELKKIETRLRAESGYRLDHLNPSIKTDISTKRFAVRASLDISPLAADGFHLDVRRLEKRHLSLVALIENGTLSSEAAAYLYFCVLRKRNIVAVGEPGSGKTTMINALDLLTPPQWRKITIEDVIESIPQRGFGKHQVRLKVEPFEEKKRLRSKGREIISLLHRTPDLIYLGEIQTPSHSKAMFHALSAGLRGLQTCHADSPEQAIVRWVVHHNVPLVCIHQIGIIIHMKKVGINNEGTQRRRVVRICEIKEDNQTDGSINLSSSSVQLVDIFRWNPSSGSLMQKIDLFETPSLQAIREYETLARSMFEGEFNKHKSLFETLVEKNEADINSTTRILGEVSREHVILKR